MFSKRLAFGLLAAGCLAAAGGGAYLAARHNASDRVATALSAPAAQPSPAAAPAAGIDAAPDLDRGIPNPAHAAAQPPTSEARTSHTSAPAVHETKAKSDPPAQDPPARPARVRTLPPAAASTTDPQPAPPPVERTVPPASVEAGTPMTAMNPAPAAPLPDVAPSMPAAPDPAASELPEFEDVVLPASSVIGLQVETSLSSERTRVEDRVDARVTRDVMANGRVAIPAGSRMRGSVTLVERGGKMRSRARLGIRFHTLILAGGSELPLQTEPIFREGESPANDSAKKIGSAAVGGAILGAILGGGKGAILGGTTGAAGGTAIVMSGDRNPATFVSGTSVTARLSSPVTIQVQKHDE